VQGKGLVWGTPKSYERRQVPIPRFLVAELREHIARKEPDDLVFTGARGGGPLRAPIFRAGFHLAAKAIGIPSCTRTSCATPPPASPSPAAQTSKVVQQMLGHSSAAMTMDVTPVQRSPRRGSRRARQRPVRGLQIHRCCC
jgi:integrase